MVSFKKVALFGLVVKVKIGIIKPIPITSKIDLIISKIIEIKIFFLSSVVKIS